MSIVNTEVSNIAELNRKAKAFETLFGKMPKIRIWGDFYTLNGQDWINGTHGLDVHSITRSFVRVTLSSGEVESVRIPEKAIEIQLR